MALQRAAGIAVCAVLLASASTADAQTPLLVTLAGNGQASPFPGGAATVAGTSVPLSSAAGIAPDPSSGGTVFADPLDNRLLLLGATGDLTLLAGNGTAGYDGGYAYLADAQFRAPNSVAPDVENFQTGYIIGDSGNNCTRLANTGLVPQEMNPSAGQCMPGTAAVVDGTPGSFGSIKDVEPFTDNSAYYVADGSFARKVAGGSISTLTGGGSYPPADGTTASSAWIGLPTDIAATTTNNEYYVATQSGTGANGRVLRVIAGKVYTVAGGGSALGDGGPATSAELLHPSAVVLLANGSFLIYDAGHARIRRVSGGTITTIAGNGSAGSSPDGTPADQAQLAQDGKLAVTNHGIVFTQGNAGPAGLVRLLPATSIVNGPSDVAQSSDASFTLGSWDSAATYKCKLDSEASYTTCHSYSGLSEGSHTFRVRATTDNATRIDTIGASRTWVVDHTPPPAPTLTSPGNGATLTTLAPTLSWQPVTDSGSGVDHYDVLLDGAVIATLKSCDATCSFTPGALGEAAHSWQVRAVDAAGNQSPSEGFGFTIAIPPVAALAVAPARSLVNRDVVLDASGSTDIGAGIARYEFDADGNGTYESDNGPNPKLVRRFDKPQTLTVGVRVTDGAGLTSSASGALVVTVAPPTGEQLGVSINDGAQYTNDPKVTVFAVWPTFASNALVSNDGGFKKAESFPVANEIPWTLDSSGPERLPKTIYVRFTAGGQVSETFQDDIILDETPPKVLAATIDAAKGSASAAAAKVILRLKARDNVSGVGKAQVTRNKRKPGKLLAFRTKIKVVPAKTLYVRVRDRAGNFSAWRTVKRG